MGQLYWLISMPILLPTVVKLSGWGKWPRPWLFMASWKWKWKICLNQRKWCLVVFHSNELLSLWAITGIITSESREQLLKAWHNMVSWELQIYNHCFWHIYLYTFSSPRSHSILRVCPDCLISRQHSSWVMLNTGRPFTWTKKLNKTNSGILWIYLLKSSSPFCKGQPWRQESFF